MGLSVIGAGFGRTGTDSLKTALEVLGLGRCHHMLEVIPDAEQREFWYNALSQKNPDWDFVFRKYRASVDWPSAYYWRELSVHFPNAKVILSVRDAESWYSSFTSTILPAIAESGDKNSIVKSLIVDKVFAGNVEDKDHMIQTYLNHIVNVQSVINPQRLLTLELGSGWQPLCDFLDLEVPDQDYPSKNQREGFAKRIASFRQVE